MHSLFSQLKQTWASRSDPGGERSLFFSRNWIYGAIVVAIAGIALNDQAISLVGFLVLASAGLTAAWNRAALAQVHYDCTISATRAFPGDIVQVEVTVLNEKPLPVPQFSIDLDLADALLPLRRASTLGGDSGRRLVHFETGLRPFERRTWRLALECQSRGSHMVGPVVLRSGDPFGFFANRRTISGRQEILVFPNTHAVEPPNLPYRRPLGELTLAHMLVTDPLKVAGVRDYRPEDPFRSIHWKATARHGSLQVKVNDPVTALELVIFLNLDTFSHYWEGLNIAAAERAIEIAGSLARWAINEHIPVGLCANGIVVGSDQPLRIPPGRGIAQEEQIMTGLGRLWAFSTIPMTQVLTNEARHIPAGSAVLIVTPMMNQALEERIAMLVVSGVQTLLIPVEELSIPDIAGLRVIKIDSVEPAGMAA